MNNRFVKKVWERRIFFFGCMAFLLLIGAICLCNIYPRVEFELSASANAGAVVQVYYVNEGMGDFDAEHMVWDTVEDSLQKYSFHIPASRAIRIDFGTSAGTYQIGSVIVKTLFTTKEIPAQYMVSCFFSEDVSAIENTDEGLLIESTGIDPYIVLDNINEISGKINFCEIVCLIIAFILFFVVSGAFSIYYDILFNGFIKIVKEAWSMVFYRCLFCLLLIGAIYLLNTYPRLEFKLSSTNSSEIVQIYYLDKNMSDFDSEHVRSSVIASDYSEYGFFTSNSDILRIDFGTSVGVTQIKDVVIKNLFTTRQISAQFISTCDFSADVGEVTINDGVLLLESIGLDPYVILRNFDTIDSQLNLYNIVALIFAFILIIIISKMIAQNYMKIECLLNIKKENAVIISCMLFFTIRIIFLWTHTGFFAIDEFHHLSTLNPDYITDYDRAPYINYLVSIFYNIFGQSDWSVKIIPFLMGSISFLCALYLLYNIYNDPYWIITICGILTFLPNMLFNHFYIRMYVFLEALVMLNCVLIYNAEKKRRTKWEKLNLLAVGVLTAFYSLNTRDVSAQATVLLMFVLVLYFYRKKIKSSISQLVSIKTILLCSCIVIMFVYVMVKKAKWIKSLIVVIINGAHAGRFVSEEPVFLRFIFIKMFFVTIPFIISLIYIHIKKEDDKKLLFLLAGLPLFGYMIVFHSTYYLRSYAAFMPIMCILAYLLLDRIKLSGLQHLVIILLLIILTIRVDNGFWWFPQLANEAAYANLGEAVKVAKNYERSGYEIVTLMTFEKQSAYFDLLDVDINLNSEDLKREIWELDHKEKYGENGYMNEELKNEYMDLIQNEMKEIFESDISRVVIADESGIGTFWKLYEEEWGDKCEVRRFGINAGVIIIN